MTAFLYDNGREAFATGSINWGSTTGNQVVAVLVDNDVTDCSVTTLDTLDDIDAVGTIVGAAVDITVPVTTDGTVSCADIVWSTVSGLQCEAIVFYWDTGTPSTSTLIAYLDSTAVSNLPVTPNGGDITFEPHASGIFTL